MSVELKTETNIKYINIKMKKKLKNNSEIIYIIKDAGELSVKILLFLLCCENLEKIDFEFMKNNVQTRETNDEEFIRAVEFWKEKNILDYEITPSFNNKGANMDNIINIILNINRDINVLKGAEPEGYGELDEGLGIYSEKYIKSKKEKHKPEKIIELKELKEPDESIDVKIVESEIVADEIDEIDETVIEIETNAEEIEEETQIEIEEPQITQVSFDSEPASIVKVSESLETKEEFRRLVQEAQTKMQTMFNFADLGIMYNLHEVSNIEVDLILKLAEMCAEEGKNNIRYLEKVALGIAANGITKISQYEDKIREIHKIAGFEDKIKKLFNIGNGKFTSKEKNYIKKWAKEFNFSDDVLIEGYKRCMKQIEKLSLDYINKIYTNWHEKGFKTLNDINNEYGVNPDIMNNIVNKKNAGVNVDQFFEKAVRKGVKF